MLESLAVSALILAGSFHTYPNSILSSFFVHYVLYIQYLLPLARGAKN